MPIAQFNRNMKILFEINSGIDSLFPSNLNINVEQKQSILEIENIENKADEVLKSMNHELQVLQL